MPDGVVVSAFASRSKGPYFDFALGQDFLFFGPSQKYVYLGFSPRKTKLASQGGGIVKVLTLHTPAVGMHMLRDMGSQ